ncbi:hypothetical protein HK100_004342 [Physocladia obscura]|uniref:TIR domain-containing protein n=1 Tax=Physocladia obscura TaxID=109957 RepID=A0AAD5ST09_9FUNG|nr:hypothetical protein HK100_004342 [Physocladia obscura]
MASETEYEELPVGPDGEFVIPKKKSRMYNYRWEDGFVSPFLPTAPTALESLIRAIHSISAEQCGRHFNSIVDLGSGRGDILFAFAKASSSDGLLDGKLRGQFVGIELDESLVAESNHLAQTHDYGGSNFNLVFAKGDIITQEIFMDADEMVRVFGQSNATVESIAMRSDIITAFLLPNALAKIIPFLRRMIEIGKVVISIKWAIEYSGQSLEEYRDLTVTDDLDLKAELNENALRIADLESTLEMRSILIKNQEEQIQTLKKAIAICETLATEYSAIKIQAMSSKLDQAIKDRTVALDRIARLEMEIRTKIEPQTQHQSYDQTTNNNIQENFTVLMNSKPPIQFKDSGVSHVEPAVRCFVNWFSENGFLSTNESPTDQVSISQLNTISVHIFEEEETALKVQIANYFTINKKARAVLAKAMYQLHDDARMLEIVKAKILKYSEFDQQHADFLSVVEAILRIYPIAVSLKRLIFAEEDSKLDWKTYSWESTEKTLKFLIQDRLFLKQRKTKLEREIGDLERQLEKYTDKRSIGVRSDIVKANLQAKRDWQDWSDREYDYFISYRVASDADLAKELYFRLRLQTGSNKASNNRVFLDVENLKDGNDWTEGFSTGLKHSKIVVLLVSKGSLERMKTADQFQDNVLLEWENAILAAADVSDKNKVFIEDVITSLYSIKFPENCYDNRSLAKNQCFLSAQEIIHHLCSLQGIFLTDPKFLKQILPKFSEKLNEINSCWDELLNKARKAKDDVQILEDISEKVVIEHISESQLLNAFLEHTLTYFHSNWKELEFKSE